MRVLKLLGRVLHEVLTNLSQAQSLEPLDPPLLSLEGDLKRLFTDELSVAHPWLSHPTRFFCKAM